MEKISREEALQMVLDGLQVLIMSAASRAALEQESPQRDPDASDGFIKTKTDEVKAYRRIREEIEQIATGVILS